MRLLNYLNENISKGQLKTLEKVLDSLFKSLNIDVAFTKHFIKRVNDPRNHPAIKFGELQSMFVKAYSRYADQLKDLPDNTQRVLHDLQSDINLPFVLRHDKKSNELDLVAKTVMRSKEFRMHGTKELKV